MGKHAEQTTTGNHTPRQPSRKRPRPLLPLKTVVLLATFTLFLAAFVPMLIIPLQHVNQALAHGSVETATVTSSDIMRHRGGDSQRIRYYFKNDSGEAVFGRAIRDKPQSPTELEKWSKGKQVTVHYASADSLVVGDVMPDRFYMPIGFFVVGFPLLLMITLKSMSEVKARNEAERVVLNPKPGTATIRFNHETNRSELPASRASGFMAESYTSLSDFRRGVRFDSFGILTFILAVVWTILTLSLLTLAQPTPDGHMLALSLSLMVVSALCCLSCALCHRAYLAEIEPERDAEISRRRQLLEDHRKNVKVIG